MRRVAVIGIAVVVLLGSGVVTAVRAGFRLPHPAAAPAPAGPTRITDRTGRVLLDEVRAPGSSPPAGRLAVRAPHFVALVQRELVQLGFRPGRDPLVVRTTLDDGRQQAAEQVVRDNLQANLSRDRGGQLSSALVSMEPGTGQIEAMVGSPDFSRPGGAFDYASVQPVNIGSSLLPFVYAKALQDRRIGMDTTILDGPSPYVLDLQQGRYSVVNYDRRSHGSVPARVALANVLNIPAVRVETAAGLPAVVDVLRQLGLTPRLADGSQTGAVNAPDTSYGPSLVLGGYPVTVLEEVSALSALADLGVARRPEAILRVTDPGGHVLYQADPHRGARPVLDPGVAYITDQALSDDTNRRLIYGAGSPLHLPDHVAAAIPGTAENFKAALTGGFTPDLATVVWVGDVLGADHFMASGSDGVFVAAPAWHRFMEQALANVPADHWYAMPADVVRQGGGYVLTGAPAPASLP